jgi:hypothetical protein
MPKFIGRSKREGTREGLEGLARPVRLSWSQQRLLPADSVRVVLDTSDRGGPRRYAKRWWKWYADADTILNNNAATDCMRQAAKSFDDEVKGRHHFLDTAE